METNQEVIELLKQIAHNTAQSEIRILALENTMNEIEESLRTHIELTNSELSLVNTQLELMNISEGFNLKDLWQELSDIKYKTTDNGAYVLEDVVDAIRELESTIVANS